MPALARIAVLLLMAALSCATKLTAQRGDLGNGHYRNPILFADYSDPDVIRVGHDYYMVASTFHFMPGIPVLHSRDLVNWQVNGPYEFRTVLAKGATEVNGPHQGGYVETPDGKGWFLHFQSKGAYGRIDRLEPVRWTDDWPVIGEAGPRDVTGAPVSEWVKPVASVKPAVRAPSTSDEFSSQTLSQQWEWNHNPDDEHWSLKERAGFLRLKAMSASGLLHARNTLTEVPQDPAFEFKVSLDLSRMTDGEHAGISMFSSRPSWVGVVQSQGVRHLTTGMENSEKVGPVQTGNLVQLRIAVREEMASYSYSQDDGQSFSPLGEPQHIYFGWWKGVRPSVFNFNQTSSQADSGIVDVDWVHYTPQPD